MRIVLKHPKLKAYLESCMCKIAVILNHCMQTEGRLCIVFRLVPQTTRAGCQEIGELSADIRTAFCCMSFTRWPAKLWSIWTLTGFKSLQEYNVALLCDLTYVSYMSYSGVQKSKNYHVKFTLVQNIQAQRGDQKYNSNLSSASALDANYHVRKYIQITYACLG